MKRLFTFITVFLSLCVNSFAQATSLIVDCQNPGWLSNMITYEQQQSIVNLTVTGYINGTDIKFIRELNKNLRLRGVLNLENANIVSGGNSYYSSYTSKTNKLTGYSFAYLDSIQKIILPNSLTGFEGGCQFLQTYVDTLVINGSMNELRIGDGMNNLFWKTRCIYFPEGLKTIDIGYLFHSYSGLKNIELFLPSTLEYVTGKNSSQNIIIHCSSTSPEEITSSYSFFEGGIIYVPKGTTEKYKNSIFRKLTIIEDIPVERIEYQNKTASVYVADSIKVEAAVYPSDALRQEITYEVSDSNIISVSETGTVTGKAFGQAYVYAFSYNKEYKDSCLVSVFEHTTGVTIPKKDTLKVGGTKELVATTLPQGTSDNKIVYTSKNPAIASVDENGVIRGLSKGNVEIVATSVDGNFSATCIVSVLLGVESLKIDNKNVELIVDKSQQLNVSFTPSDADNKTVIWSSADASIATVDESGNVTGVKAGETRIKAISADNPEVCDSCKVTVLQPVTGITLDKTDYTIKEIGESVQLEATVLPRDANNKNVMWKSSDDKVCFVSNGKVVAVGYGTCVIIATTEEGGFMATCKVTVQEPIVITVTTVSMEKHELTLNVGAAEKLNVAVSPANAENKTLAWLSTDETVATVDSEGNVTALQTGETWIKAISEGNAEASDSCLVIIRQPATGIMISPEECTLSGIGSTAQLNVLFQPENASNQNVTWKSLNEKICTVTDGTVTAVGKGTSVVIATSEDGGFMAYCTITIVEAAAIQGDVNQDGKVDISDIVAIINTIAGDTTYRNTANVNNDSNIDISDIVAVINIIAGQ